MKPEEANTRKYRIVKRGYVYSVQENLNFLENEDFWCFVSPSGVVTGGCETHAIFKSEDQARYFIEKCLLQPIEYIDF